MKTDQRTDVQFRKIFESSVPSICLDLIKIKK